MEFLPVLEFIDRLCIARVKHRRTGGANQTELDWYESKFAGIPRSRELDDLISRIIEIHDRIWDLEWQLKSGKENELSLEQIGLRAIEIRNLNNQRIKYKNSVAELLRDPVREIKKDHLSE